MDQEELSSLSDAELLEEARRSKSFSITNAFLIGFLFGIVMFSLLHNSFGLFMLLPLYMIHKFVNDPKAKRAKAVNELLKARGLV